MKSGAVHTDGPEGPPAGTGSREARRAAVRIGTNYVRLGLSLALGLTFVPFMLSWLGPRAIGLILLLGAGVGLAAMFREITTRSVVREVGAAYHSNNDDRFREIYNSALAASFGMACLATAVFIGLYFFIAHLEIPDQFESAARVMLVSQGVYILLTTALSPTFNMLVVMEKFVPFNLWVLGERCTMLFSAVALYVVLPLPIDTAPRVSALSDWAILVAILQCLVFLIPVFLLMFSDARLRPSLRHVSREGMRTVGKTLGLYVAAEGASALYEKVGQLIVNLFFGLTGNTVFGLAYQFVAYVRQATTGVTIGLDAVSARLSAAGEQPLRALMHHSTRLHGLAALPAGVAVFLLAEPLIRLWLGARFRVPELYLPGITLTVKIISVSMTARAIAEGWMMILYGAGFLRRYAPLVLTGGVLFPILTISLLWALASTPDRTVYVVPIMFCAMQFTVYSLLLPVVVARCTKVRYREVFQPLWRPAVATALAAPILVVLPPLIASNPAKPGLIAVALTGMAFGAVHLLLAIALVLTAQERERFIWAQLAHLRVRLRSMRAS